MGQVYTRRHSKCLSGSVFLRQPSGETEPQPHVFATDVAIAIELDRFILVLAVLSVNPNTVVTPAELYTLYTEAIIQHIGRTLLCNCRDAAHAG